jgi:predicted site-specific integrase-resolvase
MEEKWYTYKEILELLGVHKQTLNNWRRNGNIIYKRLSPKTFLYKLPETENIQEDELSKDI